MEDGELRPLAVSLERVFEIVSVDEQVEEETEPGAEPVVNMDGERVWDSILAQESRV